MTNNLIQKWELTGLLINLTDSQKEEIVNCFETACDLLIKYFSSDKSENKKNIVSSILIPFVRRAYVQNLLSNDQDANLIIYNKAVEFIEINSDKYNEYELMDLLTNLFK